MGGVIPVNSKKVILEVSMRLSFNSLPPFIAIENSTKCSKFMIQRFVNVPRKYLYLGWIINAIINFAI